MIPTSNDARPREGRWARAAFLGLVAAGWGADLFEDPSDPWLTVPRFLLMTAATSALIWELTSQAQRRQEGPAIRWSGSDTVNVSVMAGYAVLLCAALTFRDLPQHERTSGPMFAALYLTLGAYFLWLRRRTLVQQRGTATNGALLDRVGLK